MQHQLPNDHLGLRPPVRITSLAFLQSSPAGCHLVTGTQFGDLRKYDTRAGRRPVCNWTGLCNVGGVKALEKGFSEQCVFSSPNFFKEVTFRSQLFISDSGSTLSSIDLRTGSILHRYKGNSSSLTFQVIHSPTIICRNIGSCDIHCTITNGHVIGFIRSVRPRVQYSSPTTKCWTKSKRQA